MSRHYLTQEPGYIDAIGEFDYLIATAEETCAHRMTQLFRTWLARHRLHNHQVQIYRANLMINGDTIFNLPRGYPVVETLHEIQCILDGEAWAKRLEGVML